MMRLTAFCLWLPALVAAPPETALDRLAPAYVKLMLAVGRHDASFVDAYYGPAAWKAAAAKGQPLPVPELRRRTRALLDQLRSQPASPRSRFLEKQLVAAEAFLRRLAGERLELAEEAKLFYDIPLPVVAPEALAEARAKVGALAPGEGPLEARLASLQARFQVPPGRLQAVAEAALAECKRRTAAILPLPAGERFRLEMVTGKPWGGYNWYEGRFSSLIQVNTDLPMAIEEVLPLLAHEGYPGHHVYNALLESRLVAGRGWVEYTVYPLYSPQSVVAEGTAVAALGMIMDEAEHRAFLKDRLAPLAGLDTADLDRYLDLQKALGVLGRARLQAARMQLDEGRPEAEVEAYLVREGLLSPARARKALDFSRINRAYLFTYTVGRELVEAWCGQGRDRVPRYVDLLSRPVTPGELAPAR